MHNEIPLYLSVLYSLMQKILYGDYQMGQKLPPREKLAQEFHVSEITVRKSIQELVDRGYLETLRGRPPIVSVDVNSPVFREELLKSCSAKKATALDVIQTNRMVFPPFLYQGLMMMDRKELLSLSRLIQYASSVSDTKQIIKIGAEIDEMILGRVGSPLLMEYYASIWSFLSIIICSLNHAELHHLTLHRQECLQSACQALLEGGTVDQREFIAVMQSLHDSVASFLRQMIPTRGGSEVNSIFYQGTPVYLLICIDLMKQIYSGQYSPGDFLPSDDSVAQTYHVAVNTVRQAYQILKEIGFTESIPGVGTRVILGQGELPGSNATIHNTQITEVVDRYLDVTFFSSIVTAEIARCAVKRIDMDDVLLLEKSLERYRALPSTHHIFYLFDLLDVVINHTNSRTLQEFYLLHKSSFFLGSYLSNQMEPQRRDLYLMRCQHLLTLLRQGDGGQFADQFGCVMSDLFEESKSLSVIINRSPE